MEDQLRALGLVVNAIMFWNSWYVEVALDSLKHSGTVVNSLDVARQSPLLSEHINMLGKYGFMLPEGIAGGQFRPLHNPDSPEEYLAQIL